MMVYIVTYSYCYGGYTYISDMFTTKNKADKHIKLQPTQEVRKI